MSDTPFRLRGFTCVMQGPSFLAMKEVNLLRRKVLELLQEKRAVRHEKHAPLPYPSAAQGTSAEPIGILVSVQDEAQYRACRSRNIHNIVTPVRTLYCQLHQAKEPIGFHEGNIVHAHGEAVMGGENGALSAGRRIVDRTLNLTNSYAVAAAASFGAETMVLSGELDVPAVEALIRGCHERGG